RFIKKAELRSLSVADGVAPIPMAIVAEGKTSRVYLDPPNGQQKEVKRPAVEFLEQPITNDRRWFSPPLYGLTTYAHLFTNRQLVALTTFSDLVIELREKARLDAAKSWAGSDDIPLRDGGTGAHAYSDAISMY